MSKYTGLLMVFLALGSTWSLKAQKKDDFKNTLGLSAQVYPAGFIPTINYEHFLNGPSSLLFRFGGNFVDRQDFSDVNETEEGSGFGGTIGYRRHFSLTKGKLVAGLNFDIWNLNIDFHAIHSLFFLIDFFQIPWGFRFVELNFVYFYPKSPKFKFPTKISRGLILARRTAKRYKKSGFAGEGYPNERMRLFF